MTWFTDGVEMTPCRKDGLCSRCTITRTRSNRRAYKAKWRIGGADVEGGYIMKDGTAPEPITLEQYEELMPLHDNKVSIMMKSLGRIHVDWVDVCGYCKKRWEVNPNEDEWTHYSYALYCQPIK